MLLLSNSNLIPIVLELRSSYATDSTWLLFYIFEDKEWWDINIDALSVSMFRRMILYVAGTKDMH